MLLHSASVPGASTSNEASHAAIISRADRLLSHLRSTGNPSSSNDRYIRRHCNRRVVQKRREYQRNLVVIDYPGSQPPTVQVFHDYDKVYEGVRSH